MINNLFYNNIMASLNAMIEQEVTIFNPLFTNKFIRTMSKCMWQYMNKYTMGYLLYKKNKLFNSSFSLADKEYKEQHEIDNSEVAIFYDSKDVHEDDFNEKYYRNSIVFKGNTEIGGHYVYINKDGIVFGTYEDGILLSKKDDGICHGYALLQAFLHNGLYNLNPGEQITRYPVKKSKNYHLGNKNYTFKNNNYKYQYRKNFKLLINNYIIILKFYKHILNDDWLEGVNIYFPKKSITKSRSKKNTNKVDHEKNIDEAKKIIDIMLADLILIYETVPNKFLIETTSGAAEEIQEDIEEKIKELQQQIQQLEQIKKLNNTTRKIRIIKEEMRQIKSKLP